MNLLAKLKFYLVSADPGHVGLRMGVRVMLTVAAVCLALVIIGRWVPMNTPAYMLGLITAIQGAAQINDPTVAGRAVTRFYAAVFGFIVIAGVTLVQNSLIEIDAWLLVVIFVAAYSRRFGSRWQAVGVFAFMCGIMGAMLDPPERDLTEIGLALVVSGVVAHLVRNHVIPEKASRDFRRVVAGTLDMSQQLREVVGAVAETRKDMRWDDALRIAGRLRSDVRMCQNYLPLKVEGPGTEHNSEITLRLMDLQLAAETALDVSSTAALRRPEPEGESVQRQLAAMKAAETRLQEAVTALPADFPHGVGVAQPPAQQAKAFPEHGQWLKDEQFRLAIQVTLACAIAMIGGHLISSDRWYWAVMTAFLIFMNTQSSGAVAVRGISRSMGTLAGIALGIGLATLVSGDIYLTVPLVGISIFGAFYLARISYGGMMVCLNIAISLIYGLLGIFTPSLLVLRLEETAIGAAAGIFAALAILPLRTGNAAERAMNRFLLAIRDLIDVIINGGKQPEKSITAAASAVDMAFGGVMKAYDPMRSFWTVGVVEARTHNPLRRAYLLTHAAHLLEHSLRDTNPTDTELQELRLIQARLSAVAAKDVAADRSASDAEGSLKEHKAELSITDQPVRYAIEITSEILREVEAGN